MQVDFPIRSGAPSLLLTLTVLSLVMLDSQDQPPRFLLIVRERVRPESLEAYGRNELEIAAACSLLSCPHPYLALVSVAGPKEVWWLNAFASKEEQDEVGAAYARNRALMAKLGPLAGRKEGFRESLTTSLAEYRPGASRGHAWRVAGTRFFVVSVDTEDGQGTVFESPDGRRFAFVPVNSRVAADSVARGAGPGTVVLAVEPRWSFPAPAWMAADPEFWRSHPAGRNRQSRHPS